MRWSSHEAQAAQISQINNADRSHLAKADAFLYGLSEIPFLVPRLEALIFKEKFKETFDEIEKVLHLVLTYTCADGRAAAALGGQLLASRAVQQEPAQAAAGHPAGRQLHELGELQRGLARVPTLIPATGMPCAVQTPL